MAEQHCTPESLFEMRWVSDPQLAPDDQAVAYVEHWVEEIEKDGKQRPAYRSAVYLSTGPDTTPRRLTFSPVGNDSAPRWSRDGQSLAFISTRDGDKSQLFVLDLAGGEARQVTKTKELSEGVAEYDWHPSGRLFCLTSLGHKDKEAQRHAELHDEKVYEGRLPIKYDNIGFYDERRAQLYRVGQDGSECIQLTRLGRKVSTARWSPDGRHIAFLSQNEETRETVWVSDIFVVTAGGEALHQLTRSNASISNFAWSPDSAALAYVGHDRQQGAATVQRLWHVTLTGGEAQCLTESFDGHVSGVPTSDSHLGSHSVQPAWDEQSRITFVAMLQGRAGLYRIPAQGGVIESINTSGLSVVGFTQQGTALAFTGETNTRTAEVYTTTDGHQLARRSHAGDAFLKAYHIQPPEHIRFKGADDWEIEGWFIRPASVNGGKSPLILYVHGGPHLAYGNALFHEFQVLAAAGFGVFFTNPRGSASYGQQFASAVRQHFGEKDYEDILHAADVAASWDWVAADRMGIMGGSYGGFMTNWAITHTDRFAAACTQRSICNLLSFAGTSDIGPEFSRDEYGGLPWTDEELLMAKSPIRYVNQVKTPTLILHQEQDHRCPIEQAEQLYTALVELDVPTKFVRFPDEGHEMPRSGQPQRRVNRMHHILDWFTRYLKP